MVLLITFNAASVYGETALNFQRSKPPVYETKTTGFDKSNHRVTATGTPCGATRSSC